MNPLQPRDLAPSFTASAAGGKYDGRVVSMESLRGHVVVLYFYPKDDTPGCTTQACGIRDAWIDLKGKAELFGISPDNAAKHAKFIAKHQLPFPLLIDEDHQIAEAYGVWVEKTLYGRKFMGVERSTFVIDPGGRLRSIWRKVKPATHAQQLLDLLR